MDDFDDRRKERMRWRHRQDQERSRDLFDAIRKGQPDRANWIMGIPPGPSEAPDAEYDEEVLEARQRLGEFMQAFAQYPWYPAWVPWAQRVYAELQYLDVESPDAPQYVENLKDQLEQGGATPLGIPALLLDGALFRLHV